MQVITLYDGQVNIEYDEHNHIYYYEGKPVDGVTNVNKVIDKPRLNEWKIRSDLKWAKEAILEKGKLSKQVLDEIFLSAETAHDKPKEDAGVFGTSIHAWVEAYAKGQKPEMPKDRKQANRLKKFVEWVEANGVEFLESERIVFSREHLYCGTLDLVFKIGSQLHVGDIKTSTKGWTVPTGMKLEWFLQTAAYQRAYFEETGVMVDQRTIIRIGNDGMEVASSDEYDKDLDSFLAALTLTRRVREYRSVWGV